LVRAVSNVHAHTIACNVNVVKVSGVKSAGRPVPESLQTERNERELKAVRQLSFSQGHMRRRKNFLGSKKMPL
jgi:hypothetical protein